MLLVLVDKNNSFRRDLIIEKTLTFLLTKFNVEVDI